MKSIAEEEKLWEAILVFKRDFDLLIGNIETEFSDIIEGDYKRFTSELKLAANYIILFKSLILSFKCKKIGEGKGFHGINELVDSSTKKFRSVLGNKHRNAE